MVEGSVLLASTFTGMQHSVGERVQGPEPERERSRDGSLQEEMDERQRREVEK